MEDLPDFLSTPKIQGQGNYIGDAIFEMGVRKASSPFVHKGDVLGMPFNLCDLVNIFGKEIIPPELGIYHLFHDDMLIYAGMSTNLQSRLLGHLRNGIIPFDNVLWFCASKVDPPLSLKQVMDWEKKIIQYYTPTFNQKFIQS